MTIPTDAAALASRQGGHISRRQLNRLGMSEAAVTRRVMDGSFEVVAHGVYRLFDSTEANALLQGAVLALPDAVVSHESAARLHSIRSVMPGPSVVSVDASTTYRFPGVTVHRNRDLVGEHRTRMDGLPVTSIARTVFDLAAGLSERRLTHVVDELLGERRLRIEELDRVVGQLGKRGKPGTGAMRRVLAERRLGGAASASRLELLGLDIIKAAGLPEPVVEYSPLWASHLSFDAAYPEIRMAIEWDSRRWHTATARFEHDRRRDRLAVLNGWVVLRFTWEDVTKRTMQVGNEIARAIESRSKRLA